MIYIDYAHSFIVSLFSPSDHAKKLEENIQTLAEAVLRITDYANSDAILLNQQKVHFSRLTTLLDTMQNQAQKITELNARVQQKIMNSETISFVDVEKRITCVMQDIYLDKSGGLLAINQKVRALNDEVHSLEPKVQIFERVACQVDKATVQFKSTTQEVIKNLK